MNNALTEGFPPFKNEKALELAIASVCAKFGKVKSLRILPAKRDSQRGAGNRYQCLCLLQLDSPQANHKLSLAYKTSNFANDLIFSVDVNEKWNGPSM